MLEEHSSRAVDWAVNDEQDASGLDVGVPGRSAQREHERRRTRREQRVRKLHPRIGGLLLSLQDAPQSERAWARGAEGETQVAAALRRRLGAGAVLLHDRQLPRSRANIDHIAVAPSGVWVIDAKRYKGRVAVVKPWFGAPRLTIAGRDKTALVTSVQRQVASVQRELAPMTPDAPVHGALCFVDAELPLLGSLSIDGIPLLYPRALAKRIASGAAALTPGQVAEVAALLAQRLPSA